MTAKDLASIAAAGGLDALKGDRARGSERAREPKTTKVATLDTEARILGRARAIMKRLKRVYHADVAEVIGEAIEEVSGAPLVHDRDLLWSFDPDTRIWRQVSRELVTRIVAGLSGQVIVDGQEFKGSRSNADGVLKFLEARPKDDHAKGFFEGAPRGVAVDRAFLSIQNGELVREDLGPDHRARARLPIPFDPTAKATRLVRALGEWFEGEDDASEKAAFVQEFAGVCLFGEATRLGVAAIFSGEGANGKSVAVDVISGLFPPEAVTAIPAQDIGDERMGAGLDTALLNAVSELPERVITSSEGFKAAVTGEAMTRRRAYGREFTFRPRAGHLFAANRLPAVTDSSNGFWRRAIIIAFNRTFGPTEREPGLAGEILRTEGPGVLTWAVEGARRAMARRGFVEPPSSVEIKATWRTSSNPVALWLEACCEVGSGWTEAMPLYRHFREWSSQNGFALRSITSFGAELGRLVEKWKRSSVRYGCTIRVG